MSGVAEALEAIGEVAAGQWGLVTTAQARAEGLRTQRLARLAESGVLERLRHGVYRVVGVPAGPHDELRAAWLALAPAKSMHERLADPHVEVVSHRSAALLHRLGDLDAEYLEFTTQTRKQTRDRAVRLHRGRLQPREWTVVDGLPVTTVLTTVRDLAATRTDGGHLAGVVRDAVTTHHVGVAEVSAVLSSHAHHYGAPLGQGATLLQRMLKEAGIPESTQAAGRLVTEYALPEPIRQLLAALTTAPSLDAATRAAIRTVEQANADMRGIGSSVAILNSARQEVEAAELKQIAAAAARSSVVPGQRDSSAAAPTRGKNEDT